MTSVNDASTVLLGVALLLMSLVCLGSWPALLRLCSWKADSLGDPRYCCFCLRSQDRHPCCAYIDYAVGYTVASLLPLVPVLISQETIIHSLPLAVVAVTGGCLLSVGNLCMQWATAVYGAPLTTVLALQASMTVILGTFINYLLEPEKTAHPDRLAWGVVAFLVAIIWATRAQTAYHSKKAQEYHAPEQLNQLEQISASNVQWGLGIAVLGGFCFGFFSPCFNIAVNDPFGWSPDGGFAVAHANIWFACAFGTLSLVGNLQLLSSSGIDRTLYFHDLESHKMAWLAGIVCALGNLLQFQGGHLAGYAAADLVQAFPLVATLWDVVLFGEFQRASQPVFVALLVMYVAYIVGIVLLASSISI